MSLEMRYATFLAVAIFVLSATVCETITYGLADVLDSNL